MVDLSNKNSITLTTIADYLASEIPNTCFTQWIHELAGFSNELVCHECDYTLDKIKTGLNRVLTLPFSSQENDYLIISEVKLLVAGMEGRSISEVETTTPLRECLKGGFVYREDFRKWWEKNHTNDSLPRFWFKTGQLKIKTVEQNKAKASADMEGAVQRVKEMIFSGKSKREIIEYLVGEYGYGYTLIHDLICPDNADIKIGYKKTKVTRWRQGK